MCVIRKEYSEVRKLARDMKLAVSKLVRKMLVTSRGSRERFSTRSRGVILV